MTVKLSFSGSFRHVFMTRLSISMLTVWPSGWFQNSMPNHESSATGVKPLIVWLSVHWVGSCSPRGQTLMRSSPLTSWLLTRYHASFWNG